MRSDGARLVLGIVVAPEEESGFVLVEADHDSGWELSLRVPLARQKIRGSVFKEGSIQAHEIARCVNLIKARKDVSLMINCAERPYNVNF